MRRASFIWMAHAVNAGLLCYQTVLLAEVSGRPVQAAILLLSALGGGAAFASFYHSWKLRRHLTLISHKAAARRRKRPFDIRPGETPWADKP